jgi:ferritin-like metal-binding protein YciE
MPETVRDTKIVELLNEAYGKEQQLTVALEQHLQATTRPDYEKRLTDHLKETKAPAKAVSTRITQLGGPPAEVSLPGPEGVSKAAQGMQDMLAKAKAAAQAPLDVVRGAGEQARMVHNARVELEEEAHEIATYTVIDSLATAVGDSETAQLARNILREEERMQKYLVDVLRELSVDMAHDEIPVSEINGPAARRAAPRQKTTSTR